MRKLDPIKVKMGVILFMVQNEYLNNHISNQLMNFFL